MRQAGIVAAAGLYALEHNVDAARRRPRPGAPARRGLGRRRHAGRPRAGRDELRPARRRRARAHLGRGDRPAEAVRGSGLSGTVRPGVLRAVTHLDLDDADIELRSSSRPRRARRPCPRLTPSPRRSTAPRAIRAPRQAERLPSLAAAVVRDGQVVWSGAVGLADIEAGIEATPETQYRVGLDHEDVHRGRDHAAPRRREARPRRSRSSSTCPESPTGRRRSAGCWRTSPGSSARRARCSSPASAPTIAEVIEAMAGLRARAARRAGRTTTRTSRFALLGEVVARNERPALHRVRRRADPRAARPRADDVAGAGAARRRLPRRRVRGHRRREPHSDMRRGDRDGAALVDGRTTCAPGAPSSSRAARASSTRRRPTRCGRPQVMLNPDDWTVGWGLGLELVATTAAASSAATAARCRASWPASTSTARRGSERRC